MRGQNIVLPECLPYKLIPYFTATNSKLKDSILVVLGEKFFADSLHTLMFGPFIFVRKIRGTV
jgi:hypothetical protein